MKKSPIDSASQFRFWVILFVLIPIVCMGILELGARFLNLSPQINRTADKLMNDPYLPWMREPLSEIKGRLPDGFDYHYKYNSKGFRDEEHDYKKAPGTFRIVALGDSFTHGSGAKYEDTYLVRLEKALNEYTRGAPKIEIIKMGVSRYWTEPERLMLQHYGLKYDPDLVIVGFVRNDINDTQIGLSGLKVSNGFLVNRNSASLGKAGIWLTLNSDFFRLALTSFFKWTSSVMPQLSEADAWEKIYSEFDKILNLAKSARTKAKTVILHISGKSWTPRGRTPYQQKLFDYCQERDCSFIDSVTELRKEDDPKSLYWQIDGHCTGKGYGVVARALLNGLIENSLVPGPTSKGIKN